MKVINDVPVLTMISELVEQRTSAVIVIDMQNEIVSPKGGYQAAGSDVSDVQGIVPRIALLLDAARARGILVTYVEFTHRSRLGRTYMDGPNVWVHRNSAFVSDVCEGTWAAQTVAELAPKPGDVVIEKHRGSGFAGTPLDAILRERGARSVIITGTSTSGCVLFTAVDAMHHGYYPVLVRDCVASGNREGHNRALAWMETKFPAYDLEEVLSAWQTPPSARGAAT